MSMMMGPNGKALPVATGASLGGGGSAPAERLTRDAGYTPMAAEGGTPAPHPKEEAAQPVPQPDPPVPPPALEPVAAPPHVAPAPAVAYQQEDIDAIHERLDRFEGVIKNKVTLLTVLARIDALEAWLKARIGD